MNNAIAGILLAAGRSTRFGCHKLLHTLPNTNIAIAVQSANNLLKVIPQSIAVVRENDEQLGALLSTTGITIVVNPDSDGGVSSSIRCGIRHFLQDSNLGRDISGYLIALADMPYISPTTIQMLVDSLTTGELICAPVYNNQRGHPVGFSAQLTDELLTLQGDVGAKFIIEKYLTKLHLIETGDNSILRDIDFIEDLR